MEVKQVNHIDRQAPQRALASGPNIVWMAIHAHEITGAQIAVMSDEGRPSPQVSSHTYPFGEYMKLIDAGDWQGVGELMLESGEKLAQLGADFCVAPCNTIHIASRSRSVGHEASATG